jgi:hypothetical protein
MDDKNIKKIQDLEILDEYRRELEFKEAYTDPTEGSGMQSHSEMKKTLIKNIGLKGATVKELPHEKYTLTYQGKDETLGFEDLIKRLVTLATEEAQAAKEAASKKPTQPPAPAAKEFVKDDSLGKHIDTVA